MIARRSPCALFVASIMTTNTVATNADQMRSAPIHGLRPRGEHGSRTVPYGASVYDSPRGVAHLANGPRRICTVAVSGRFRSTHYGTPTAVESGGRVTTATRSPNHRGSGTLKMWWRGVRQPSAPLLSARHTGHITCGGTRAGRLAEARHRRRPGLSAPTPRVAGTAGSAARCWPKGEAGGAGAAVRAVSPPAGAVRRARGRRPRDATMGARPPRPAGRGGAFIRGSYGAPMPVLRPRRHAGGKDMPAG